MKLELSYESKRKWRNRLIFVLIVTIAIFGYVVYINSFNVYSFRHLTTTTDMGAPSELTLLSGTEVPNMVQVAENANLALYINLEDTTIAVHDRRNGHTWFSDPPGAESDPISNLFERNTKRSHLGFRFYDEIRRRHTRWLFSDSVENGNFEISSIPNGVRIAYTVGDLDLGIDALPFFMETSRFQERVLSHFTENADIRFLQQFWLPSQTHEGFMQMTEGIRNSVINSNRMIDMFYEIGYTLEELEYDLDAADQELEISFDFFTIYMEFALDGDSLIVNIPLADIEITGEAQIFDMDLMRFFGAGSTEDDGFILVPGGSGGVINFNNGRSGEDMFISTVYGLDDLLNAVRPQIEQPVRLPIIGIQNNGAAMLAHVQSGQALTTVNADVAGRTNSFNRAWFSFTLRSSIVLGMGAIAGGTGDMTVVQNEAFDGDITVRYHFLAGDNPGLGEMAAVYRNFLIETGALTRIAQPGDRTFYLDILGALDVQRHFFGVPYMTTELMTSTEDAHRFIDILHGAGIHNIQMQLHGWFNRGINHDVAKNINLINSVGRQGDLVALNNRLESSGGNLNPAVNFQLTNFFSRNMNRTFETAKDPAGYIGVMTRVERDTLSTRFSQHNSDWFLLVHPAVLPMHIDSFISEFQRRVGVPNLALTDLGALISENMYRRDPIDREHSRLLVENQMERLANETNNLVVFGGNDYSLRFASHIVDAPIEGDMFNIVNYEVPFFSMIVHGYIEFAGKPVNMRENFHPVDAILKTIATGAAPRYTFTSQPTRQLQFSPHERFYSTQYANWIDMAIEHYHIFNEVYAPLRNQPMVDFEILAGGLILGSGQVTVTVFEDGTRIYVNRTHQDFEYQGLTIPARWFLVA
ncbi:MAG: DUF5696 domain-containing protein [Defluviitaleaceae bacterium]|nr:DUF5696 domain-containing protein [Defluviitaleaceae bacterium]